MTDTMTCDDFESVLPRLLDGDGEMTAAMQAHLDQCAACRALLTDLRTITAKAGALPALQPERDLWSGIAARIEAPVVSLNDGAAIAPRRVLSWRVAGMAAAAIIVVTTGITYEVTRRDVPVATVPVATKTASAPAAAPTVISPAVSAPRMSLASNLPVDYDREIARLRMTVDSGRTRLDPATVALLERNLTTIDSAIVQCREALARDPASKFLIESLKDSYQTKVQLLRMAAAATKG